MDNYDGCKDLFAEVINAAIRDALSYKEPKSYEEDDSYDPYEDDREDRLKRNAKKARSWLLSDNAFLHFYLHSLSIEPDSFKFRMKKLFSERDKKNMKKLFVKFDKAKNRNTMELSEGF